MIELELLEKVSNFVFTEGFKVDTNKYLTQLKTRQVILQKWINKKIKNIINDYEIVLPKVLPCNSYSSYKFLVKQNFWFKWTKIRDKV